MGGRPVGTGGTCPSVAFPHRRVSERCISRDADTPSLVKTAFYGDDANWGRVAQAAGQALSRRQRGPARNGRPLVLPLHMDIAFGPVAVVAGDHERLLTASETVELRDHFELPEVDLSVHLHRGDAATHLYFSDLTHQYVTLNAEYTT